ncbi:alpha-glucuronidase [Teratosphaeria nubilosa]|uniref:Alpha-glucuronidase n=1 Tax=Teratosphaeria nubilosa TaxID=161662 RepID=A0A6G1LNR3_9PEZI|nr:alpha-glucuronidase [Teratosphaeria nubilosa]
MVLIHKLLLLASGSLGCAEDGLAAWLRYAPVPGTSSYHDSLPAHIIALNSSASSPVYTAGQELQEGLLGISGKQCEVHHEHYPANSSIIVGTIAQYSQAYGNLRTTPNLIDDGYWLDTIGPTTLILGHNERGALYGAFAHLSLLAQGNFTKAAYASNPAAPVRWTNEWDNLDGSIERGYAGNSLWFSNGTIVSNLTRTAEYARLLASIGINGVVINNVNANASSLTPENVDGLGRIADVMRPYGVQIGLSLYFSSPTSGVQGQKNLTTFDPLDNEVIDWWKNITDQIYDKVPDFAGYLVKADSEGEPGPLTYNRTLADGANLFARALQPHGGILMFRAFVYNDLDESDWYADRAKAAVDFFKPLDGEFEENVIIQIKYGPIDFQVREPPSPLFANLQDTNIAIELEITQEYLGQQCHLVYLPPLWKTVFDFDLRVDNKTTLVKDVFTGKRFNRPLSGTAGVINVGTNSTWLGSHLSMSNLYTYGRLAWDPSAGSTAILQDWIRLTFSLDHNVIDTITHMSTESWPAYENYTGNLGIQTLTDILYTHYGPNPQTQDGNFWGQWTRANHESVGMDRTCANGTCFSGQFPTQVYQMYEHVDMTPDELLLWFHHVNWTHVLQSSGRTVIQEFYDRHYAGAATAQTFVTQWTTLQGTIDDERWSDQFFRLVYQAGHAILWRDAVVNFYHNMTGIPDEQGRVGNHPFRIEAESMELDNYIPYAVSPFESASNATAIVTASNSTAGSASTTLSFPPGRYDLAINYFDLYGGASHYTLLLNDVRIGSWTANGRAYVGSQAGERVLGHTPSVYIDGHSGTRVTFEGVDVRQGDVFQVAGEPDGAEPAPLDYVSLVPVGGTDTAAVEGGSWVS